MRDPSAKAMVNWDLVNDMRARKYPPMKVEEVHAWKETVPELSVTLWPSFPHFDRFVKDKRITGIRLNSAMMSNPELDKELALLNDKKYPIGSLLFDIKGRQLRVIETIPNKDHLEICLNHPIDVTTPCIVLFKAGADYALLDHLEDDGKKLIFKGGPKYKVIPGESLHIRDKSLKIRGNIFTPEEIKKIEKVKAAGFNRYFLSYVEKQSDIDQFQELVGKDAEIWLKIESIPGMHFVANDFQKKDNLVLVVARGDLFVELEKPHHIIAAQKTIIEKDPMACVGSRILLSVITDPVPSCADLMEIECLYQMGYRRMMLCDELCLKENLLATAVGVFDGIKNEL